ncbi:MAG: hypothetical protein L6Q75_03380 [Burkholderiaceae bacterium]|nr:hypothetical protein [Burkholderiaceae bacterium]
MSYSSISLGGMNAAMNVLDSSAWRIAQQASRPPAQTAVEASAAPAAGMARPRPPQADLAADVIGQLQARNAFLVNLRTFQAGDAMLGALLDAKA